MRASVSVEDAAPGPGGINRRATVATPETTEITGLSSMGRLTGQGLFRLLGRGETLGEGFFVPGSAGPFLPQPYPTKQTWSNLRSSRLGLAAAMDVVGGYPEHVGHALTQKAETIHADLNIRMPNGENRSYRQGRVTKLEKLHGCRSPPDGEPTTVPGLGNSSLRVRAEQHDHGIARPDNSGNRPECLNTHPFCSCRGTRARRGKLARKP